MPIHVPLGHSECSPHAPIRPTYLHIAAEDGVNEAVRALAEAADGSLSTQSDAYQQTALHLAACG